jgi:hypothetical protein
MGIKIRIQKPVAILFPKVIEPEAFPDPKTKLPKGPPVYSANFCIPGDHPQWPELKAAVLSEAREKFGGLAGVKFPIIPGEEEIKRFKEKLAANGKEYKGENDFLLGCMILKTRSPKRVPMLGYSDPAHPKAVNGWVDVIDNRKEADDVDPEAVTARKAVASKFYAGALCSVETIISGVEFNDRKFVTAYLQKVYSSGQGKHIAGGEPGSAVFEAYKGHISNVDPTLVAEDVPF